MNTIRVRMRFRDQDAGNSYAVERIDDAGNNVLTLKGRVNRCSADRAAARRCGNLFGAVPVNGVNRGILDLATRSFVGQTMTF